MHFTNTIKRKKQMKLFNAWAPGKQADKFEITLRLSIVTLFEFSYDISDKELKFIILNYGIQHSWK